MLSILTGVLFGLAPALHSVRLDISAIVAGRDRRAGVRARAWRFDHLLMRMQVALTLCLDLCLTVRLAGSAAAEPQAGGYTGKINPDLVPTQTLGIGNR